MTGLGRLALTCALLGVLLPGLALAQNQKQVGTRLVIDSAKAERDFFPGLQRLRLLVTAVTLEGGIIPISGAKGFTLKVGGATRKAPYIAGHFAKTDIELAVAFVVEVGFSYTETLPIMLPVLAEAAGELPSRSQISVVAYGETATGGNQFAAPSRASGELRSLSADPGPADPELLSAIDVAIKALSRRKARVPGTEIRKLIVVVSDGKDIDPTPENYRQRADAAKRAGIRIHTVGYAPDSNLRALLGLGELSKRSGGTFRWVRTGTGETGFRSQLRGLVAELNEQYVVTYFLPDDLALGGKAVAVAHQKLESEPVKVRATCGEKRCNSSQYCVAPRCITRAQARTTSWKTWALYGGIGLGALLLVLFIIGTIMTRGEDKRARAQERLEEIRQQQAEARAGSAQRIVAHGPQGHAVNQGAMTPMGPQGSPVAPHSGPIAPVGPQGRAAGPIAPVGPQGGRVRAPAPAPAPSPQPRTGGTPHLYVVNGPLAGKRLVVKHGMLIGSGKACQVKISDQGVSRKHAQLVMDTAGGCVVIDKGSTNGTFVNGVRVAKSQLSPGSVIRVGQTELRFMVG